MARDVRIIVHGKDNASDDIRRVERALGGLGKRAIGFGASFLAVDRAISFAKGSLDEFLEAEDGSRKLALTLKNLGAAAPVSADRIEQLAASIHKTTVFEDDAARSAARLLLNVKGLSSQGFEQALKTSTDLAAMMGGDLEQAATTLARALSKPETGMRALRSAGILLTRAEEDNIKALAKAGNAAEAHAALMESVGRRVSGAAAEMASSTAGSLKQLEKDWNDVKESIGRDVIGPFLRQFVEATNWWRGKADTAGAKGFSVDAINKSRGLTGDPSSTVAQLQAHRIANRAAIAQIEAEVRGIGKTSGIGSVEKFNLMARRIQAKGNPAAVAQIDAELRGIGKTSGLGSIEKFNLMGRQVQLLQVQREITKEAPIRAKRESAALIEALAKDLKSGASAAGGGLGKLLNLGIGKGQSLLGKMPGIGSWGLQAAATGAPGIAPGLSATESRFLTRGSGMSFDPAKEAVKLQKEALKKQDKANQLLDKISRNVGMSYADLG